MKPLPITACTATSAIGTGLRATLAALQDRRSGLRPCDFGGIAQGWIGRVDGLEQHRLPAALAEYDCRNNRLADLALRQDGFMQAVARAAARHGADRVAVVLGTSTSGVLSGEDAYRDRQDGALPAAFDHRHTQDLFSLAGYVRAVLGLRGPALVVSTACASAAKSFADAQQMIAAGLCDAAVVGGADTLCRMTLRGFASLDLVSDTPCRPCDATRSGISIGEAAGFALVERKADAGFHLLGHGSSSDGHHMSSPQPEGLGALAAMRAALTRAGVQANGIDWINLHGTGTQANDAAEDAAVTAIFGQAVPCSSTKGWTGHTLGASGIVEAAMALVCLQAGLLPGCLHVEQVDPSFRAQVITANTHTKLRRIMSNAFGFGGVNCSLVFGQAA